jgi:hypothetical protein
VVAGPRAARQGLFTGRVLARGERVFVAVLVAVAAGAATWLATRLYPQYLAKDFTYPWRAARALLAGANPYEVILPTGPYPFESRFPYPISAAIAALPLAGLSAPLAAALFSAGSTLLLALALLRDRLWRLLPLVGASFLAALSVAQWSPLLVAGALLPWGGWALACKPTLGAALFVYRPSWRSALLGAALLGVGFLLVPTWLTDWIHAGRTVVAHPPPVLVPFGWVPLLALLRWRRPEARLVAAMALVPQNLMFYDQLPLWLAATTPWRALALTASSWIGYGLMRTGCPDVLQCGALSEPWVIGFLYVPATVIALLPDRASSPAPTDAAGVPADA